MSIYVLGLKNGKYYVGKTNRIASRIAEHYSGEGCAWTRLHKPLQVLDTFDNSPYRELATTLLYMQKYGIDNVRGSTYSRVKLTKREKTAIQRHLWSDSDLCILCGSSEHFVKNCDKQKKKGFLSYIFGCCRRHKNDPKLGFGKYSDKTYSQVLEKDPGYCEWVKNTPSKNLAFNTFKNWLNK